MDGFTGEEQELAGAVERAVRGLDPLIRGANAAGLYVALWVGGGAGAGIFEPGRQGADAPGAGLRVLVFKARLGGEAPTADRA